MKQQDLNEFQRDIWLERQLDAIRQIRPPSTPEVTDAVMQRVAAMPTLVSLVHQRRRRITVASGIVAACLAAMVTTTLMMPHGALQAANSPQQGFDNRLYELYNCCHDLDELETVENAAYLDNPVTIFF